MTQRRIVDQNTLRIVIGVQVGRAVFQVEGEQVRRKFLGRLVQHLGKLGKALQQSSLTLGHKRLEAGTGKCAFVTALALLPLRQHRADARMRILHVVNRIFLGLEEGQIDVEGEFGLGLPADQEKRTASRPAQSISSRSVT